MVEKMEPPQVLRKVKSTLAVGSSPSVNGRASPMVNSRHAAGRPMSPAYTRPQVFIKRPPSAARVLDVSKKPSSAFEQRPQSANAFTTSESSTFAIRSSSAMSNRAQKLVSSKGSENTTVSVRVRPAQSTTTARYWEVDAEQKYIKAASSVSGAHLNYTYDNVFTGSDSNETIYEACVKQLVGKVLEGFHGTVFAYGMTGTGKTYSMQGTAESAGIIPQAVRDMFDIIDRDAKNRYVLRMSYLEIYNEKIKDLLNDDLHDPEEIKIREDARRGIYAYPLIEIPINSTTMFLDTMDKGNQLRHSAATDFNAHSSRSHAVVQIVVESTPRVMDINIANMSGTAKISTLNLIDLAGSEKASSDSERRKEGSYINKSLLTLGTVIARLTSSQASSSLAHIPFRDSKLTRLLQNALSGQSLVSILATINADANFVMETTNTLKFASRAKFISGSAKKAELFGGDVELLIESLRTEVANLRARLAEHQHCDVSVRKKGSYTGPLSGSIHFSNDKLQNTDDETDVSNLKRKIEGMMNEQAESEVYIKSLQQELLKYQAQKPVSSVPFCVQSPSSPGSPPGNFSYPLRHALRTPSEVTTPSEFNNKSQEDYEDRLNALADKELAANVLTKSQRSREQARDLTAQIAQFKKREDKKTFVSRLGFQVLNKTPSHQDEGKENGAEFVVPRTSPRTLHTLVSPSIRAPREAGFF